LTPSAGIPTVSEKGQITIPEAVRQQLGIKPGTVLEVETFGGRIVAAKSERADPLSRWRGRGRLPGGVSVDEYLKRVRG
jgi:AbrB family looped-hinge helix DNA binding protein